MGLHVGLSVLSCPVFKPPTDNPVIVVKDHDGFASVRGGNWGFRVNVAVVWIPARDNVLACVPVDEVHAVMHRNSFEMGLSCRQPIRAANPVKFGPSRPTRGPLDWQDAPSRCPLLD